MSSLHIEGLTKRYTLDSLAVNNLSLALGDGKFTTLLGPSGCGKTTTLRCLAGLETPDRGLIQYGEDIFVDTDRGTFTPPHKRNLGMVFQSYALWPNRTVMGNVSYPLRLRGVRNAEARRRAAAGLTAVGLEDFAQRFPHELSGGQQQRVALARGLVSASGLLLFDEPLSNLDAKLRLSMREEIRRLHDEFGYSCVYVTHDQEEALAISDNIVVMDGGRVLQTGTPHEIFTAPETAWVASFVGFDNIHEVADLPPGGEQVVLGSGATASVPRESMKDLAPGEILAFRSDEVVAIDASGPRDDRQMRMRGRVVTSSYLGDAYRLQIDVSTGTRIVATVRDDSRIQMPEKYLGESIELGVPLSSVLRLPGRSSNHARQMEGTLQ